MKSGEGTDMLNARPYLCEISLKREQVRNYGCYPFNIPAIRKFKRLTFHPDVTFIVGENGCGKSTLLKAIASAWGFNPEGGSINFRFSTRPSHSDLCNHFRSVKFARIPRELRHRSLVSETSACSSRWMRNSCSKRWFWNRMTSGEPTFLAVSAGSNSASEPRAPVRSRRCELPRSLSRFRTSPTHLSNPNHSGNLRGMIGHLGNTLSRRHRSQGSCL